MFFVPIASTVIVQLFFKRFIMVSDDLIRKGLTISGSWHWNLTDTKTIMDTIAGNKSLIAKFVTHKFPLIEAEDAFKLQISGNCGKVLLHPVLLSLNRKTDD